MSAEQHAPSGIGDEIQRPLVRHGLRTPRAAAIAGIIFSVLLIVVLFLLRVSVPTGDLSAGDWLRVSARRITVALNLVPFAGVAFMWFLGVLRDRLGPLEDQFFATVFFGSGLMFLGMLFVAAAAGGALVFAYGIGPDGVRDASTLAFGRAFAYNVMQIYAFRMAAVFMFVTSTMALRTRFTPVWIAWLGYGLGLFLLVGGGFVDWTLFAFPAWVLLVSLHILFDKLRPHAQAPAANH